MRAIGRLLSNPKEYAMSSSIVHNFEDSAEATAVLFDIHTKLNSAAMHNWAKVTDKNFGTKSHLALQAAMAAYEVFITILVEAA
jgi:hypothetical protein